MVALPIGRVVLLEATPKVGNRPSEVLSPKRLLNVAGIRVEPAISVVHPKGEPRMASRAPSPVDEDQHSKTDGRGVSVTSSSASGREAAIVWIESASKDIISSVT